MTDRRRASGQQDRPGEEDNPFAPPPEGQPDRPWQPRRPQGSEGSEGDGDRGDDQRQRWGSQWSRRQPKRQGGGFGEPPRGEDGGGSGPLGPRWDPADPAQRHARYAVLAGMWGVLSGLLGWEWLALLLGALALYWGISALRGGPAESGEARNRRVEVLEGKAPPRNAATPAANGGSARQQRTAAIAGIVMAAMALSIVAASYTLQLVYKDYFDCVDDALTTPSQEACEDLLPERLRPMFGEQD